MLVAAFVQDVACDMLSDPDFSVPSSIERPAGSSSYMPPHAPPEDVKQDRSDIDALRIQLEEEEANLKPLQTAWPDKARSWRLDPTDNYPAGRIMPGIFNNPREYGILPRLKVLDGWNPSLDVAVPPFHPVCLSTRSNDPAYNLTPTATEGWAHWVHPEHTDKPYLVATKPGSWATFELGTGLGVVKVYSLKSKTFGLGNVQCWVDDEKDRLVLVEGWWDNGDA